MLSTKNKINQDSSLEFMNTTGMLSDADLSLDKSVRKKAKFIDGKQSGTYIAIDRGHNHTTGSAFESKSDYFKKPRLTQRVFNRI